MYHSCSKAIQYKYDVDEYKRKAVEWTRAFAPKVDMNVLKPVSSRSLNINVNRLNICSQMTIKAS